MLYIVQEAFIVAFKAMNSFRGLSSEKTWIMTIARNKLHDWYRKQFRNRERFEDEALAEGLDKFENLASELGHVQCLG
jgi:RNA polymerase sigma-70 factor (ECF subfamily)